ncbi:Histidine kinase-, DNA gyrase B-, and HSP90-like ATPase [Filimonas lacunae]|uniref:histidine kinase n=1 Tax=Filimonas lacunae TaxID=477680 RepID=A0A173MBX6_9BACT|nr:HAMP domain-containing sensor histidine kinase [Filimonas lacunae]BAV05083.1 sensory box histidine kinase/response regulator [Filimonas lacunae]SIT34250.1 Histidine kinase-, DNA gyrase B-, and HSP90-like ATPase [Filimonas lacunae]
MPETSKNNSLSPHSLVAVPTGGNTSNHTIELFLGMFAHELRAQIAGTVQACLFIRDGEKRDDFLQAIETTTLETLHVLDNMLDTVKIHNGKLNITVIYAPFCFKTWIVTLISTFKASATQQKKSISLTFDPSLENATITSDEVKLGQIVQNLLSNALKFSHRETTIQVKCYKMTTGITIQVINDGIGIPPEKAERLFMPYEQLDKGFAGAGLGLYLSNLYAQALRGSLTVISHQGNTVFTLFVPVYR